MTATPWRSGSLMCAGAFMLAVAACHSARPGSPAAVGTSSPPCEPPSGALPPGVEAAGLAGEYRLHIAATSGPSTGQWAEGALRLEALADPAARAVVVMGVTDATSAYALTGSGELDPASLGAVSTGSLAATDPEAPGVLVIERHPREAGAGTEIILRLGSDANRRGRVRYDGGYFALTVRGIGPRGFTGTWSSGAGAAAAEGYFCAERLVAGS